MTTVKETDRTFVKAYVQDYADAITENYRLYHIDSMERMLSANPESTYAAQQLNDIQTGKANLMKFVIKTGKKKGNASPQKKPQDKAAPSSSKETNVDYISDDSGTSADDFSGGDDDLSARSSDGGMVPHNDLAKKLLQKP